MRYQFLWGVGLVIMFLTFSFPTVAQTGTYLVWYDGFDDYPVGQWPSGWTGMGNAPGDGNYVDDAESFEGGQSLRLEAGNFSGCWEALAFHELDASAPFTLKFAIYITGLGGGGCHANFGSVSVNTRPGWSYPGRTLISFRNDGTIVIPGGTLGSFSPNRWYEIWIDYERSGDKVRLTYWINGQYAGDTEVDAIAEEDELAYVGLHSGDSQVWFDSVSVEQGVVTENSPPYNWFEYEPENPKAGEIIDFYGYAVDDDGWITSWLWDFGDGWVYGDDWPQGAEYIHLQHAYEEPGTYGICMTVWDNQGAESKVCTTIYVEAGQENEPPNADFTWSPTEPEAGEAVQFTDASSDPDGAIVSWQWDFGDGSSSTSRNPAHVYDQAGTYDVCLTVTDDDGAIDKTCKTVHVNEHTTITILHITDIHIGCNERPILLLPCKSKPEEIFEIIIKDFTSSTASDPDRIILVTGDIADFAYYDAYGHNPTNFYQTYNKVLIDTGLYNITYSVPGNHDRYPKNFALYSGVDLNNYSYNVLVPDNVKWIIGDRMHQSLSMYTFEYNGILFIGLDSGYDAGPCGQLGSPAETSSALTGQQWAELKKLNPSIPKVIFLHHPAFYPEDNEDCQGIRYHRQEFQEWCKENNVILVLSGHTHESRVYFLNYNDINFEGKTDTSTGTISIPDDAEGPPFVVTAAARDGWYRILKIRWVEGKPHVMIWPAQQYQQKNQKDYTTSGWNLISVPKTGAQFSPSNLVLWHWNPVENKYDRVSPGNAQPWYGYWLKVPEGGVEVTVQGEEIDHDVTVEIPVPGWQMISAPWPYATGALRFVHNGEEKSFADAIEAGWVANVIWGFDPEAGQYSPATTLDPWQGYWLKFLVGDITMKLVYADRLESSSLASSRSYPASEETEAEEPPSPPLSSPHPTLQQVEVVAIPNPVEDVNTTTFRVLAPEGLQVKTLRIKIYDLSGRLVWSGEAKRSELVWHTQNLSGAYLANGVYLYQAQVETDGSWITLPLQKLAILR